MKIQLFLMVAALLPAQSLDDARMKRGDDMRWADPAFDDRGWETVRHRRVRPMEDAKENRFWLRMRVTVPEAGPAGEAAVVAVIRCPCEVFLDGIRLGATGDGRADGSRVVLVGDVSGKGLKAAMLVAATIGMLRRENSSSPGAILAGLNDALAGHTGGGFVTCCCARFGADGTVTIANAGHPSPYCDGRELELAPGLPLGIMADAEYEESVVPGERFTFVSDGVIEAENAQRELFGFDRTREISTKSAQEIAEAAKAWGQNDDITVVTVRRRA